MYSRQVWLVATFTLADLKAFADDAGCDVVKDNEAKVFLFRKRKDSPTAKY